MFSPLALEARSLSCSRGGRRIFSGLSFRLEPGRLLVVAGPNGAGKSSLLRLVAGLIRPDGGSLVLEGGEEDAPPAHYLGHADALKPAETLREMLRFWSILNGQGRAGHDADLESCAETVGLRHALDLPAGVFSAGQRRRAALARLTLTPRPMWLLDEPTTALDADGEAMLGAMMRRHLSAGGMILAATHRPLPVTQHMKIDLGMKVA